MDRGNNGCVCDRDVIVTYLSLTHCSLTLCHNHVWHESSLDVPFLHPVHVFFEMNCPFYTRGTDVWKQLEI